MKKIKHILEALIARAFLFIFKLIPASAASSLGGFIARGIGSFLSVNRLAKKNINKAFPHLKIEEVNDVCDKMWDNLGRVVAEFAHLNGYIEENLDDLVEVEGLEHIYSAQDSGKPIIFFGGHIANWEIIPRVLLRSFDDISIVYRKANNPLTDKIINNIRGKKVNTIPKGAVGARKLINLLKDKKPIIMLVDQKQNDGIAVPFFGHDAMTASAIASLSLKNDCEILPVSVRRVDSALKFKLEILPAISYEKNQTKYDIMVLINNKLEDIIKKAPHQWFWVHNRWPKKNS